MYPCPLLVCCAKPWVELRAGSFSVIGEIRKPGEAIYAEYEALDTRSFKVLGPMTFVALMGQSKWNELSR